MKCVICERDYEDLKKLIEIESIFAGEKRVFCIRCLWNISRNDHRGNLEKALLKFNHCGS